MTREEAIRILKVYKNHAIVDHEAIGMAIEALKVPTGTYQCFHCLEYAVIWDNDFSLEDAGYVGEGIIHYLH